MPSLKKNKTMKLYRLDYYQDDCGELIGFFTSQQAALEYAFHDKQVGEIRTHHRTWTEIWEFTYSGTIDLDEKLDGMIDRKAGLHAWEKGGNMYATYYV